MSKIIKSLIEGNKKFKKKFFTSGSSRFRELVLQGQKPKALVVTCSDSRVNPDLIFSCEPGDLFMVRNVAALVPPFTSDNIYPSTAAALEFAIESLDVRRVVVLGHSNCGGIESIVKREVNREGELFESALARWLALVQPVCRKVITEHPNTSFADQVTLCTQSAIASSVEQLMSYPWISKKVEEKHLVLYAWYFSLLTGRIDSYDHGTDDWISL